jgi:ribosomal protein S27E
MAAGASLDLVSWPRAPGEEVDDEFFLGVLESDDISAVWQKEGDIVVWTREYVRSQVGAPLFDVGLMKASQGRPQGPPPWAAALTPEQASVATSTEPRPIARSIVGVHRCPECHSLNESAKFSRRSGGTTCQVCGRFDALLPDAFLVKRVGQMRELD